MDKYDGGDDDEEEEEQEGEEVLFVELNKSSLTMQLTHLDTKFQLNAMTLLLTRHTSSCSKNQQRRRRRDFRQREP